MPAKTGSGDVLTTREMTPLADLAVRGVHVIKVHSEDESEVTLATVMGVSRPAAYAMVARGDAPSIKIGRRIVIPVAALRTMLGDQ